MPTCASSLCGTTTETAKRGKVPATVILEITARTGYAAALPVYTGRTRGTTNTGAGSCVASLALIAIATARVSDGAADAEAIAAPNTTDIGWCNSATRNAQSRAVGSIRGTFTCSYRFTKDRVTPLGTERIAAGAKNTANCTQTNDAADRCRDNGSQSLTP